MKPRMERGQRRKETAKVREDGRGKGDTPWWVAGPAGRAPEGAVRKGQSQHVVVCLRVASAVGVGMLFCLT